MGLKLLYALALFLLVGTFAIADVAPSPAPGAASLVAAPNPNPVNYNFVAGTLIASAQVNTNYYKVYSDFAALTGKMNATTSLATSYTCPFCLTQLVNGSGLTASLSGAGVNGQTLTIALGIVPIGNGGTGTTSPSLVAGSSVTITGAWPNQTVSTFAPSAYNSTGTQAGFHIATGVCNAVASQSCAVTLAGAQTFSSGTSYTCTGQLGNANSNEAYYFEFLSITATTFTMVAQPGPVTFTRPFVYNCIGY